MTLLVTHPRRSLGTPVTVGAPVDVEETPEVFRIELDLPGVPAQDVQIELRDSEVRVLGTFGERRREGMLRHHARRSGEFEYVIALPGGVEADRVSAELDAGVLTIVAPKARGQQARRIELAARPAAGNPAAAAKQMKERQSSGTGSTGQVGRSTVV